MTGQIILNELTGAKRGDSMEKYYCAVCEKEFVLEDDYGGCTVCDWMHDPVQEDDPDYRGGANRKSLNEAKAAWAAKDKK